MAERPISLSKHRKARARTEKRAVADANAVKFGRPKAEKRRDRAEAEQMARRIDGHRREPGEE